MSVDVANNLSQVLHRIHLAEAAFGRVAHSVQLLAVSKTKTPPLIRQAYAAGQTRFGESYAQEAHDKMAQLADLPIEWHFIGPIQSNKTKVIADAFSWVHSVDRLKIAQRLSDQRSSSLPPLNVCIQLNISHEASKSGVDNDELLPLAQAILALPRLKLRGLMAIPAPIDDMETQKRVFARVRQRRDELQNHLGVPLDTLSMGMSDDLEAAIAEGATIVRVGTGIFGGRTPG